MVAATFTVPRLTAAAIALVATHAALAADRKHLRNPELEALRQQARAHEAAGRADAALGDWTKAVRLVPADPGAAMGYGRCLHRVGRHEEAHRALTGALYLVKDLPGALDLDRQALHGWAAIDPKVVQIDRESQKRTGDVNLLLRRVRRLHVMGADKLAEADLETVLAADPQNAMALWQRGRASFLEGRHAAALPDLAAAAAAAPGEHIFGRTLVRCLIALARKDEADRE